MAAGPGQGNGLGREVLRVPCPDGTKRELWGTTGAGPGYYGYALSRPNGDRQLVAVATTNDLAAELADEPQGPWPLPPFRPLTTAFC